MTGEIFCKWSRFLEGSWTLKTPTRPGEYPIATRDGDYAGIATVVSARGEILYRDQPAVVSWQGFWWSEPLGPLPDAPDLNS